MANFELPADLPMWLLYAFGAMILLIGFIAVLIDFLTDFRITDIGGFLALLVGAVILLGTFALVRVARARESRRLELLRRYYLGRADAALLDINHNIVDTAQAAMMNIEVVTDLCHQCLMQNLSVADCVERINTGKERLNDADAQLAKLKKHVEEFSDYLLTQSKRG